MKLNPFKNDDDGKDKQEKDEIRDPLDVKELLTDNNRKAVITADGELKIKGKEDDDQPKVELMKERYWGNRRYQALFSKRMALETRAMSKRFPGFKLRNADKDFVRHKWGIARKGEIFWIGTLTTYSKAKYLVAIVYPQDYPFGEIRAYVLEPLLPVTEHRFKNGSLCLYDHDGKGAKFEKNKTTAVTITAWTAAWLHAYEIWRTTGEWPELQEGK